MDRSVISDELYNLSFDTIEEDSGNEAWFTLIQNLSHNKLVDLSEKFKKQIDGGLDKEQFLNAICVLYGNSKYGLQSNMLFNDIANGKSKITWKDFLDFLIENLEPKTIPNVTFKLGKIEPIPHSKRETIVKITIVDPPKYFHYAVVTKHGRVGLYDGNLNFLTSYHSIMSYEDKTRTDNERRRRNRWITDVIFCRDVQMLIFANSARSLAIYEATGLNHKPIWLLIGLPNIAECLEYKSSFESSSNVVTQECILYLGNCLGEIILLKFLQPFNGFLRKKHSDKVSVFYWDELENEKNYLEIKSDGHIHKEEIKRIHYEREIDAIISCSSYSKQSLVIRYLSHNKKPYIFKIRRGCSCFVLGNLLKLLVTGSKDGVVRVWNPVIVSKPIAILTGHEAEIIDLIVMETQKVLLTFSSDAVLKIWNLVEYKSYQTMILKFPCFGVPGKLVEYGITSIFPGPKRYDKLTPSSQEYNKIKECFNLDDMEEMRNEQCDKKCYEVCEWSRSNILITCCNYIATIYMHFKDINIEESFEMQVLPPPPLQNSVLIPSSWRIQTTTDANPKLSESIEEIEIDLESQISKLKFILDKDLLDVKGAKSDINYKIAILENEKLQMQSHVEKGAPYLTLKLFDIEEFKLSEDLPVPKKKSIKYQIDKIEKILSEASMKDRFFSEQSSSRSRSSRSSITDMLI